MKIGYFADGPWSHLALEGLIAEGHKICFIVPRYDTRDPILREWSEKLRIPFLLSSNVNELTFLQTLRPFEADLFVSMSFNQILKQEIIRLAPKGFINCHAGKLPFYRGRNPLNWALINGETTMGVTVHYVDKGIDTGDIIHQDEVLILPEDDYGTLLDKAVEACPAALLKAIAKIDAGDYRPIVQSTIHPVGSYFGQRKDGDEIIDWDWPSTRIHNFIRALASPAPGARSKKDGVQEVTFWRSELIKEAPSYISTPGEVVGRTGEGVVIKSGTSTLLVKCVSESDGGGGKKEPHIPRYRIGTRFQ